MKIAWVLKPPGSILRRLILPSLISCSVACRRLSWLVQSATDNPLHSTHSWLWVWPLNQLWRSVYKASLKRSLSTLKTCTNAKSVTSRARQRSRLKSASCPIFFVSTSSALLFLQWRRSKAKSSLRSDLTWRSTSNITNLTWKIPSTSCLQSSTTRAQLRRATTRPLSWETTSGTYSMMSSSRSLEKVKCFNKRPIFFFIESLHFETVNILSCALV
jgi:hypothetical protein